MNSLQLFKNSFVNLPALGEGKKMPFGKVVLYVLFLSVLMAIPITRQVFQMVDDLKVDGMKIAEKLPDFEIQDGKLNVAETDTGFIYQTNSIIFTFDPDGKRNEQDITNDLLGQMIGIAFLKNELLIVTPDSGITTALLGSNEMNISYNSGQLDGLTGTEIRSALEESAIPWWLKLLVLVVSAYPAFIDLIVNLILVTFGAVIYSRFRLYKLRFIDCLKIVTYCATLPVIATVVLNFFVPSFDDSFLIVIMTLLFFYQAVRNEERYELPTPKE